MAKGKKSAGGAPKYPTKSSGTKAALNKAATQAAKPTKLGNHFGKDGINPVERGGNG